MSALFQFNSNYRRYASSSASAQIVRPVFANRRVRVSWPQSAWFRHLEKRLNQIVALPQGWDGYRGEPVSFNCATFASNILESVFDEKVEAPALIPGSDGTVQIEWHLNGYDIELDVLGPNNVLAMRHDHRSGLTEELELTDDFGVVSQWVSDLSVERLAVERAAS